MSYDHDRAAKEQDATEAMIRMREPRQSSPHPQPLGDMEMGTWGDTDADHVQCSIAISLKRIADALHGDNLNTGMKHALAEMANRAHNGWGPSS